MIILQSLMAFLLLLTPGTQLAASEHPVLVELFTSEGCSSCPPADALLEELDKSQPIAGTEILVLSEHVDYWNHLGWRDPYSSAAFSDRQGDYAKRLGLDGVYTPQMVVDGAAEFVGSDKPRALKAVAEASKREKIAIRLTLSPDHSRVALRIDPLSAAFRTGQARVFLAIADREATSQVRNGENGGRRLHHVAVVRSLRDVGGVTEKSGLTAEIPLNFPAGSALERARVIAFVQATKQGRVLGSATLAN